MKKKEPTKDQWAYAAGYIDGEGCLYVDTSTLALRLQIGSCYPGCLKWLYETFGGTMHKKTIPKGSKKNRTAYRWEMRSAPLKPFLMGLLPFAKEKKSQMELGLQFLETRDRTEKAELAAQIKALKKVILLDVI